ncbi:MAG: hypothetical protein ACYSUI_00800 [Planctomycetota bacterium]
MMAHVEKMRRMTRILVIWAAICLCSTALAKDKLVLKDGRQIEGTILKEDHRKIIIMTPRGKKVYRRTRISEVVRGDEDESKGIVGEDYFALDPGARELRNARAEYVLGRYEAIVTRLTPLLDNDHTGLEQIEARWLIIDSHERLAQFDRAEKLLKEIKKEGDETNRIRAQAHLDLFEQNPGYKLERVNNKLARKFLPRELYLKGKQPDALADKELMREALEEYADQILSNEKVSVRALRESLDMEATLEALREMPRAGRLEKYLPYYEELRKVEESMLRAQAILPAYVDSYMLDLVRTEADHLFQAVESLFNEVFENYPENSSYAFDPANGKLTKAGREQWRENCEEFLEQSKPLTAVAEYLAKKVGRYPRKLRRLDRALDDILNRLQRTREAISRKKDTRIYV